MTFSDWVGDVGGISAAARILEKSQSTVWAWYHHKRFPRPEQLEFIDQRSNGQVDANAWRRQFLANKEQKQ